MSHIFYYVKKNKEGRIIESVRALEPQVLEGFEEIEWDGFGFKSLWDSEKNEYV